LNRGGNRQANSALFHIVLTRMKHHQATRDYVARRLQEGKTMGEIARILKRYVAREVFNTSPEPPEPSRSGPDPIEPAHTCGLCNE
jgi:hypothetical protein